MTVSANGRELKDIAGRAAVVVDDNDDDDDDDAAN
jgi:hypothetical protein